MKEIGAVIWGKHPVRLQGEAEHFSESRGPNITQYRAVVMVNRLPFLAIVSFSSWPAAPLRPSDVFANVSPDTHSSRVVKTLEKAAAQVRRGERKPTRKRSLIFACPECMKPATEDKFKKALMLPSNARLAVCGNWILDIPCTRTRPASLHALCLIHDPRIRAQGTQRMSGAKR